MIPNQLRRDDFKFIKLIANDKKPIEPNYKTINNYSHSDLERYKGNIGILCGYGNLIVVDFDNLDYYNSIKSKLPDTFTIQTAKKKLPHLYYIVDKTFESVKITDGKKSKCDLICQGSPSYVVTSPSEIDGNRYEVINDLPIQSIKQQEIFEILGISVSQNANKQEYPEELQDEEAQQIKKSVKLSTIFRLMGNKPDRKNMIKCIFHNDSDPSLHIDDDKGLYHCFGCKAKGDVITLYRHWKGVDFKTAKDQLRIFMNPTTEDIGLGSNTSKLKSINISDLSNLDIPPVRYIVDKIILERGITILGGEPGEGKSLLALDLAISISTGSDFLGYKTTESPVFYIDEENDLSLIKTRSKRLFNGKNKKIEINNNLIIYNFNNLIISNNKNNLVTIHDLIPDIEKFRPKLLIFDSLVRFIEGDENSSNDMKLIKDILTPIILKYDLSVLLLHHQKKGSNGHKSDLRGSGDIMAIASIILNSKKTNKEYIELTQTKNRVESEIEPFKIQIVDGDDSLKFINKGKINKGNHIEFIESEIVKILDINNHNVVTRSLLIKEVRDADIAQGEKQIRLAINNLVRDGIFTPEGKYNLVCNRDLIKELSTRIDI